MNRALYDIIGHSSAIDGLRRNLHELADEPGALVVSGEPGSGVNLAVQSLHLAGRRAHRPLLRFDCAIHAPALMRAELLEPIDGEHRLHAVAGGTLLLDNGEHVDPDIAVNVLHAANRNDVRLAVGTHAAESAEDLLRMFDAPSCRSRLVTVPPLRERGDDVVVLADYFAGRAAIEQGLSAPRLTLDVAEVLRRYDWPENVRELMGVVRSVLFVEQGQQLTGEMFATWLPGGAPAESGETLRAVERKLIEATFGRCRGNRQLTAETLGIGVRTLSGKLREYGYPPRGGPGSNRISVVDRAA